MDPDLLAAMAEDAESDRPLPTDEELSAVSQLAARQVFLEEKIREIEGELEETRNEHKLISEVRLPQAIEKFGLSSFTLKDGKKIEVSESVQCGLTKENQPAGFRWLEEHGLDDIIKQKIELAFGKGQGDTVSELTTLLAEHGYTFSNSRSIHHSTLAAFVRRRLKDALPIPADIFSIFKVKKSVVTLPKK